MSNGEKTLTRDEWRKVQAQLKTMGFYFGQVDGKRGSLTDNAIVAFKRSIGFRARPFFGPDTYNALMERKSFLPDSNGTSHFDLPWISYGNQMLGLHEKRNYANLVKWFKGIVPDWADPREIAWCGAFVAVCFKKWKPEIEVPENILGARQWGNFGEKCTPQRGAVLTFWRGTRSGWQGHVGFMMGQDRDTYHVLGGNQSDAVTIAKLSKTRLLESRWPTGFKQTNDDAYGTLAGTISTNEA